jgi:hypothetical protein
MSRNWPSARDFRGRICAAGLTCSRTRSVVARLIRQRVLTASASPIRSPHPYISQIVAAQSAGSPAASASSSSSAGKTKSAALTTSGTGMSVQGDSASFLLRTASLNTALWGLHLTGVAQVSAAPGETG